MKLNNITLSGFKSFKDFCKIEFDPHLTAIVGPNGCGKSNISDAIRFVLGEQSLKLMRSKKMEDVIFSGSDYEDGRDSTQVSLNLTTKDDQDINVSRTYYKTGESVYKINGKTVRLKDIHSLFADTGLGKNGYSIVSQGGVEQIIEASPNKIRQLVEEAVGISGYNLNKEETLRRLKQTQAYKQRINDVLEEIKKQLKPLKKQSKKTRRFLEIHEIIKVFDLVSFYNTQKNNLEDLKTLNDEITKLSNEIKEIDNQIYENDKKHLNVKGKISDYQNEITILQDKINKQKQSLAHNKELNIRNSVEIENFNKQDLFLKEQLKLKEKNLNILENKILTLKESKENFDIEKIESDLKYLEKKLEKLTLNKKNLNKNFEEKLKQRENLINQLIFNKNQIDLLESNLNKIDHSKLKNFHQDLENLKTDLNKINKRLNSYSQKLNVLGETKLSKQITLIDQNIQKIQQSLNYLENQRLYLKNLEDNNTFYSKSVQYILNKSKNNKNVFGPVGKLFEIDKKYQNAILTALGGRIQNIVVTDSDTAQYYINLLKINKKGRVSFLPLNNLRVKSLSDSEKSKIRKSEGFLGFAPELIKTSKIFKEVFETLLSRYIIFDSFKTALAFSKQFPYLNAVSLDAEIFYPGGSITGGSLNKKVQIFRNTDLAEINNKLKKSKEELNFLEEDKEEKVTQLKTIRAQILKIRDKLNTSRQERQIILNKIEDLKSLNQNLLNLENNKLELEKLRKENKDLDEQIELINLNPGLIDQENEKYLIKEQKLREKILELKVLKENIINKTQFKTNQLKQFNSEVTQIKEEIKKFKKDLEENRNKILINQTNLINFEEQDSSLKKQIDETNSKLLLVQKTLKEIEEQNKSFLDNVRELNSYRQTIADQNNKKENQLIKLKMQTDINRQKIFDEYNLNFAQVEKQITELREEKNKFHNININALKKEQKDLGNINPQAIKDYQELNQRYQNLNGQFEDLSKSEEDIKQTIEEINKNIASQLEKEFSKLNKIFDQTFKLLFSGGYASLNFTQPENLLESGISLLAQPPGKRLHHIQLLSGGEKAMTAIALLLSFIQLNPAPFTIIDEIDAPLDENNVLRFTNYIKKVSEENQFIVITHKKNTLKVCSKINGISMNQNGISKLVSLNLEDYKG